MTALALSVFRGIVENGLEMEKVYVYLPQVNCAFSNIFASILLRSPISRQQLTKAEPDISDRVTVDLQKSNLCQVLVKQPKTWEIVSATRRLLIWKSIGRGFKCPRGLVDKSEFRRSAWFRRCVGIKSTAKTILFYEMYWTVVHLRADQIPSVCSGSTIELVKFALDYKVLNDSKC